MMALLLPAMAPAPARAVVGAELLVLELINAELAAAASAGTAYTFTGTCTDCSGTATAVLRLTDYTPGTPLTLSNLAYFRYAPTDLFAGLTLVGPSYTLASAAGYGASGLLGSLPSDLPGPAFVAVNGQNYSFVTETDGAWSIGLAVVEPDPYDFGTGATWDAGVAVPEPAGIGLLLLGLGALAGLARTRQGAGDAASARPAH